MAGHPCGRGHQHARVLVGAVAALVALAAAVVMAPSQLPGEPAGLRAVNGVPGPAGGLLQAVMPVGTLWVAAGVALAALWWGRSVRSRPLAAVAIALTGAWLLDGVAKEIIGRPRPEGLVTGVEVREVVDGLGFPSGHAAIAFALAASLHPVVSRPVRVLVWAVAAGVALARLHAGVHWPADAVGGAALGTALGAAAWLLVHASTGTGTDAALGAGQPAATVTPAAGD